MPISATSTSRIQIKLRQIGETYWFWPLMLGLAGLGLALAVLAADQTFTAKEFYEAFPWIKVPPDSARAVLTVIAGAMITAASIVYSLSLLIRTIAIGTLGPRLIETYDKVHVNRITLGLQLFSFVYSLTVLYGIGNIVDNRTLSVAIGVVIAIVALIFLVIFVHSVARQSHVDATVADIAETLRTRIDRETTEGAEHGERPPEGKGTVVESPTSGYVQGINRERACEIAGAEQLVIAFEVRSGDYVMAGVPLMRVFSKKSPDDALTKKIAGTVTVGSQRIDTEDLRFHCLLLVEIALRALSSGVNDPFTAVACIDNLGGVLARVDGRELTPDPVYDEEGKLRVVSRKLTFQDLADAIFHPLRQSGARVPTVAICLLERLRDLIEVTSDAEARKHLMHHADLIAAAARAGTTDKGDELAFKERLKEIEATLKRRPKSSQSAD
jgi:uncharacterized membrane protein